MTYCQLSGRSLVCKPLFMNGLWVGQILSVCAQCLKQLKNNICSKLIIFLTTALSCSIIIFMTIRQAIQTELKRRGWSHYRLAKELEGKIPARTTYAYLACECDLGSNRISIILQALDLQITRKPKKGHGPRR